MNDYLIIIKNYYLQIMLKKNCITGLVNSINNKCITLFVLQLTCLNRTNILTRTRVLITFAFVFLTWWMWI